ncbi:MULTISPECIES: phage tail tube protein [unclassified Veillonella]|uniref:phage tail tube protein n=1 Tax=unclassified Veillonella TaxID=2630086 RepID=UPI000F8D57DB|nr:MULTISPECIES: phage tail tube protein [unclassified Veillonella]
MKNFEAQQVMTGSHGQVWIDGDLVAEVTAFKAVTKLKKEEVKKAKTMSTQYKYVGYEGSGNITMNKVSSLLLKKCAENIKKGKATKCHVVAQLDDPDAIGVETISIYDVTFDSTTLANWKVGSIVEESVDFTFTDFDIIDMATGE